MFDKLPGLGYGLVVFAMVLGVGTVVLYNFATSTANCPTAYSTYNATSEYCQNSTGSTYSPSSATTNVNYVMGKLGSGSGGLASWTPAVIAVTVGFFFLAYFGFGGKKGKY